MSRDVSQRGLVDHFLGNRTYVLSATAGLVALAAFLEYKGRGLLWLMDTTPSKSSPLELKTLDLDGDKNPETLEINGLHYRVQFNSQGQPTLTPYQP